MAQARGRSVVPGSLDRADEQGKNQHLARRPGCGSQTMDTTPAAEGKQISCLSKILEQIVELCNRSM